MEAQGDPFRRGLPTLQTSLTLPELPCTATADLVCGDLPRSLDGGCRAGKFLVDWKVRGGKKCGFALDWWGNDNEDSALIRRLRRHLPPQRGRLLYRPLSFLLSISDISISMNVDIQKLVALF